MFLLSMKIKQFIWHRTINYLLNSITAKNFCEDQSIVNYGELWLSLFACPFIWYDSV